MKTQQNEETYLAPPIGECVACGAEDSYERALTRTAKDFRDETFSVGHHHWKCRECGVAVLGDAEMDEAMRATVAAYQSAHDLHEARMFLDSTSNSKGSSASMSADENSEPC